MILLIDSGNTRIKWALAEPSSGASVDFGRWSVSGSVAQGHFAQLENAWKELELTRAVVANVAGTAARTEIEQALTKAQGAHACAIEWFASQAHAAGVRNGYRQPTQLGCDRFAAAIGGHALFPDTALVIATCGTATTIDAMTADGKFAGGMILPGLRLMASSLARNTAQLPDVTLHGEPLPPFADNTEEAILGGCVAAQVGAIERACTAYSRLHPDEPLRALISGGAAAALLPHLAIACTHVDNLVLIGLQRYAEYL